MVDDGAEGLAVVVDGVAEVVDGDGDVVDLGEQRVDLGRPGDLLGGVLAGHAGADGLMASSWLGAVAAEEGDLVLADLLAERGVVDAEALLGGEAEHADLALVQVVVHLVGGLADVWSSG